MKIWAQRSPQSDKPPTPNSKKPHDHLQNKNLIFSPCIRPGLDPDLISFGIDYDQINVSDSMKMQDNPIIDVSLIDGFTPQVGDFFDILTADDLQLIGNIDLSFPVLNGLTFDHEILNLFDATRGTSRDVLRITFGAAAVPEPGSAILILPLVMAAALRRNRRRNLV